MFNTAGSIIPYSTLYGVRHRRDAESDAVLGEVDLLLEAGAVRAHADRSALDGWMDGRGTWEEVVAFRQDCDVSNVIKKNVSKCAKLYNNGKKDHEVKDFFFHFNCFCMNDFSARIYIYFF